MKLGTRRGEQATVRKSSRYARGRRLGKALVGLMVLSLLAACGAGPTDSTPPPTTPPPTTGGLKVEIVGLPAAVAGAVTVEGPGIPATVLTGTFEFAELEPGDYSVSIADVVNDLDEYRPTISYSRSAKVEAGKTATEKVEYVRTYSSLAVNLTGLDELPGAVTVTGPEGYETTVTRSEVLERLVPGTYRILTADVETTGAFYEATPLRASVFLAAGTYDAVVDIQYSRVSGSTVVVTNVSDDVNAAGSLRYWLEQSTLPGSDIARIGFDPASFAAPTVIQLDDELVIDQELRIVGPTDGEREPLLTLRAAANHRVLAAGPNADAVVRSLRFTGGNVPGDGGAIHNRGSLALDDVVVSGSSASYGGGIYNDTFADLQLSHSQVTQNSAGSGGGIANLGSLHLVSSEVSLNTSTLGNGGGILNMNPDAELYALHGSSITGNNIAATAGTRFGGGVHNQSGKVEIDASVISGNEAANGGGLSNSDGSLLVTNGSNIEANTAANGAGVHNAGELTLAGNSVVAGNEATSRGGGLYNAAAADSPSGVVSARIASSRLEGNDANLGGGLWNGADLTLATSTLHGNKAMDSGGGIYNSTTGEVDVLESHVTANETGGRGGGIRNLNVLSLTHSTVDLNTAEVGGGLAVTQAGSSEIFNTTFADNVAVREGGGIAVLDTAFIRLRDSTVRGNRADVLGGGGVTFNSSSESWVLHSTFEGNSGATNGGGIFTNGPLGVTNATIVENEARRGAGLFVSSGANTDVHFSTISLNHLVEGGGLGIWDGGGIYYSGRLTLRGTVVAGNGQDHGSAAGPDVYKATTGSLTSSGYNLIGNDAGAGLPGVPSDRTNVDALLGPLQHNGGYTHTMSLLPGSPALGLAPASACSYPSGERLVRDQRNALRPGPEGTCDAGAYQTQ